MSISFSDYYSFTTSLKERGWDYLDGGSFRLVYHKGDWVIKIPANDDGALDNMFEAHAWHKYRHSRTPEGLYLAPCRLLRNQCLLMVAVDIRPYINLPWKKTKKGHPILDKDQAGLYKNRVVAYDFALDMQERLQWEQQRGIDYSFFQSDEWKNRRPHFFPEG